MKKIINYSLFLIFSQSAIAFAGDVVITSNTDPAGGYQVKTDYLFFTLNNLGTLGNDYSSPGIQHDPLGGRSFSEGKDYVTPGSPYEGFSVDYNSSTLHHNNHDIYTSSPITGGSYTNRSTSSLLDLTWQGTNAGLFDISQKFSLTSTGQNLNITTTITALSDLTGVKFLRVVDPDQDSSSDLASPTYDTNNTRGSGSISATDIVCASGAVRGDLKVCLYSNSSETHNTGVTGGSAGWSKTPSDYLSGTNHGNGDNVIGTAANLGSLSTGTTKSFTYSYLFSSTPDSLAALIELAAAASGPSSTDTQRSLSVLAQRYRTPYNYSLMSSNYANMNT